MNETQEKTLKALLDIKCNMAEGTDSCGEKWCEARKDIKAAFFGDEVVVLESAEKSSSKTV